MFSLTLIIGIVLNIATSFAPPIPAKGNADRNLISFVVGLYYISLLIIIFSPGNRLINIGIAAGLHFALNPLLAVLKEKHHTLAIKRKK
jgi:hypothetical protein